MAILAWLLDHEWAEEQLVSSGSVEEKRILTSSTSRQVPAEERHGYRTQLEGKLMKLRRKKLMEERFPNDCTVPFMIFYVVENETGFLRQCFSP